MGNHFIDATFGGVDVSDAAEMKAELLAYARLLSMLARAKWRPVCFGEEDEVRNDDDAPFVIKPVTTIYRFDSKEFLFSLLNEPAKLGARNEPQPLAIQVLL